MKIPPEYYEWFRQQQFDIIDTQIVKTKVAFELGVLKNMPTEQYILWQKYEEVNNTFPMEKSVMFDEYVYKNPDHARLIPLLKSKLWTGDWRKIDPELIWIGDKDNEDIKEHWTTLRILIHSQQHSGAIGRTLNYLVRDRTNKLYLGLISIASDFLDLAGRDEAIGWTREQRTQEQRVKYTAVCSTIVPTQPFGYNCVGGKLLALLCLSDEIQIRWLEQYGSPLVGLTTTSLYGKNKGMSQYDNLKYWKSMGYSKGSSALRVSKPTREFMYKWAKTNMPQEYYMFLVHKDESGMVVRDRLNRFHQAIYRKLGISNKLFTSDHDRGIYFAPLYKNSYEFLRDEETKLLEPLGDFSTKALTELWKEKYAKRRFESLEKTNKLTTDALYYDDLGTMEWNEAVEKYLKNVGR